MKTSAALRLVQATRPVREPERVPSEALAGHEARLAAIRNMGARWIGHHAYQFDPRHSHDPAVYKPARAAYLDAIAARAAADRARSPAFQRAEAVRAALNSPA